MTENIISIIFINPHFVNPKINNFRSFFRKKCRSDAVFRSAAARAFRVLIFGLSTTYPHCPLEEMFHLLKRTDKWIVCEGVETKEMVDFLIAEGCDELQGFYYYKPMEQKKFEELIA